MYIKWEKPDFNQQVKQINLTLSLWMRSSYDTDMCDAMAVTRFLSCCDFTPGWHLFTLSNIEPL